MRRFTLPVTLVALFLLTAACGTTSRSTPKLIPPEITIQQISTTAMAARHSTGPLPVNFRVAVSNHSGETLTLTRVRVESVGEGAYTLTSTSQAFAREIAPDATESVEFWAPAVAQMTILGSNGPVTIRGIAYFNSPVGAFQQQFLQQVNDTTRRRPPD